MLHQHQQEAKLSQAMKLAQQGDAEAYRDLLKAIGAILQIFVSKNLKRMGILDMNYVDDIVQEALMAIHTKRYTYDPQQLFTPWMFAIARYKLIDFARKRLRNISKISVDELDENLETPVFSDLSTSLDLETLLGKLPERSRLILALVKVEGLSIAEAASQTQMSESAVKVVIHRALKFLQDKFVDK